MYFWHYCLWPSRQKIGCNGLEKNSDFENAAGYTQSKCCHLRAGVASFYFPVNKVFVNEGEKIVQGTNLF